MTLVTVAIMCVVVVLAGLVLIGELRTDYDRRRLRERSGEAYRSGFIPPTDSSLSVGLPVDTGHGSCGGAGYGHGGGSCDGGGHGG